MSDSDSDSDTVRNDHCNPPWFKPMQVQQQAELQRKNMIPAQAIAKPPRITSNSPQNQLNLSILERDLTSLEAPEPSITSLPQGQHLL